MGYAICDSADVEAINGIFKPIRRQLGVTAFGINEETLPPNGDAYPDHDHAEDGQEEVFFVLEGGGQDGRRRRRRRARARALRVRVGGREAEDPSR